MNLILCAPSNDYRYQAALRHRGKVVIVRPYKDAETDDVVITISQSVSIER